MKNKAMQNEYRTGGHIHHRGYGALFAVGIFLFLTLTGMLLTAVLFMLRVSTLETHKVIASLETPDETQSIYNDLHMEGLVMDCTELGITCQSISEFCENYYALPAGIYIVRVQKHTPAALQGVLPGDILIKANGEPIRLPTTLQSIVEQSSAGESLELEFVRKEKTYTIYLTPGAKIWN